MTAAAASLLHYADVIQDKPPWEIWRVAPHLDDVARLGGHGRLKPGRRFRIYASGIDPFRVNEVCLGFPVSETENPDGSSPASLSVWSA
jgi:hypothetical protein